MSASILCPRDSPGKNTGVGCHFLLQGIFLTQGSNLGLLYCSQILYHLSNLGGPTKSLYKYANLYPTLQTRELRLREKPGQSASGILPHLCLLRSYSGLQAARTSLRSTRSDGAQGQGST